MKANYTDEKNVQILISLLKKNNIKKIVTSPGATNVTFVGSLQSDSFFEMYSSVDERSAAYMACGLAEESGEVVVLSCTGATASRNYLPGLTEAYYRKLPILSITSTQDISRVGHNIAQVIDRSIMPKDTVKYSVHLPIIKDKDDFWDCEIKVNNAILELDHHGGGPVHVNLTTKYSRNFDVEKLPVVREIKRIMPIDRFPEIANKKVAIFVGSHSKMDKELTNNIDEFCSSNDAVVFCDHTSGYYGKYRVLHSLSSSQRLSGSNDLKPDLTIHIGEITGDGSTAKIVGNDVWRVSEDGELRDPYRKLRYVFEMSEKEFFKYYLQDTKKNDNYLKTIQEHLKSLYKDIPEIPFSNVWVAKQSYKLLPKNSTIHFGILNSLRSWNFFELPQTVESNCNVGGFGIDGCVSSLIGASLFKQDKLYFGIVGDLAFFYDMNSIGNRHVGNNIRLIVVNNGKGTEFRNFNHPAAAFGESADDYHAAGGHYGNKSKTLIKNYCENLGFEYISASNKDEFTKNHERFFVNEMTDKPMLFEIFTDSDKESEALELIMSFKKTASGTTKRAIIDVLGEKNVKSIKSFIKRGK